VQKHKEKAGRGQNKYTCMRAGRDAGKRSGYNKTDEDATAMRMKIK